MSPTPPGSKEERDKAPTLDDVDAPPAARAVREAETAGTKETRYVAPYVDHGVVHPRRPSSSASQMAVAAGAAGTGAHPTLVLEGVSGTLRDASFVEGNLTVRLEGASGSLRAIMQLASAIGCEVEVVLRRKS